jgi:hypothetical protein
MQGRSFRSILETGEEAEDWKQAAYYQYWMHMAHHDVPGHIAMRTKRYKLIQFYGTAGVRGYRSERSWESTPAGWELYDLEKDPTESDNVYDHPDYTAVQAELKKQFKQLRVAVRADQVNENLPIEAQQRMAEVNRMIEANWVYEVAAKEAAVQQSKIYAERFADPKQTEPYVVPWLRPSTLDPSEK